MDTARRYVLVTGASSGLGKATVLHLCELGFHVFATVRRESDGDALVGAAGARLSPVYLDMTDGPSLARAAELVDRTTGPDGLWALVNNAGICVSGPLESLPITQLREQLETNLVGQLALTQALLPSLRRARGRIVNVTSGLGKIALPFMGAYAAAQFAKEAASDALRRELRPFGIHVALVRPGAVMTPIWSKIQDRAGETRPRVDPAYAADYEAFLANNEASARRSVTTPEDFAKAVAHAITARRPRIRYAVGTDSWISGVVARILPDAALDALLLRTMGRRTR